MRGSPPAHGVAANRPCSRAPDSRRSTDCRAPWRPATRQVRPPPLRASPRTTARAPRKRILAAASRAGATADRARQLQPPREDQHQENDQNQTQSAARKITPAAAVRPRRQRADQQKNQEDEQNGAYGHLRSPFETQLRGT